MYVSLSRVRGRCLSTHSDIFAPQGIDVNDASLMISRRVSRTIYTPWVNCSGYIIHKFRDLPSAGCSVVLDRMLASTKMPRLIPRLNAIHPPRIQAVGLRHSSGHGPVYTPPTGYLFNERVPSPQPIPYSFQ